MWSVLVFLALQAWSQPAEQLWNAGKRVEAIEFLAARANADPNDTLLRRRLAEAELEVHWYAAALQHAEGLGPQLDPLRALCLYRLGDFERALLLFSRAEPSALLRRIDCLEALARFEESDLELEHLATLVGAEDARLFVLRARAAARKGEMEAAQLWYRRALNSDPSDPTALFGLGRLLVQAGEREAGLELLQEHRRVTLLLDALDFAQRAVDLAPAHASNHASVGDALRALGRTDAAEVQYERAEALATNQELAPIALRHARLLVEDRRDTDSAVRLLDKSFERSRDVRLAVRAGDLLLEAQRISEALARFESAAALRPDDAQINQRLRQAKGQD